MRLIEQARESALVLRLLPADAAELTDFVVAGGYQRTAEPAGYVFRLKEEGKPRDARDLARGFAHQEADRLTEQFTLRAEGIDEDTVADFLAGLQLGAYRYNGFQSEGKPHPFLGEDAGAVLVNKSAGTGSKVVRATTLADVQARVMALVDAPANKKRPQDLAAWAEASGRQYGYSVTVLDQEACRREGLHALLAVNRGSEDPARFIVMEYRGEGVAADSRPVAIIGKGITFDTGGLSIKGSQNLHLMKSDMGGAAATLGALEAAARLRLPVHLVGIVPSTDNSVDALSIKPSDVIDSHSGKTIEIIDTDAEGRLVMCDGLSYALEHFDPETLIDVATLTGSAVRTFGYVCAATMSKNEELVASFLAAGEACGERVWPLPGWDDFRSGLDSDVADIKNYSGRPINGAIDAFKFLEFFTDEHPAFVHLDIAGVALKQGPFAKDRQATGYGMRLLIEWLRSIGDQRLTNQ